jgi:hypothetical protein
VFSDVKDDDDDDEINDEAADAPALEFISVSDFSFLKITKTDY